MGKSSSSVTPSVEQGYSTRMKIPGFSTVQDRRVVKSAPKIKGNTKSWSAVSKTKPAPAPKTKIVERIVYKEKSRRKSIGDIEEGGRRSSVSKSDMTRAASSCSSWPSSWCLFCCSSDSAGQDAHPVPALPSATVRPLLALLRLLVRRTVLQFALENRPPLSTTSLL